VEIIKKIFADDTKMGERPRGLGETANGVGYLLRLRGSVGDGVLTFLTL
jgi:hypothetical protein